MALKRKSKIIAEFNMSSLTDIIFLLLIFFMLTSSIVSPEAIFLKLPGKKVITESLQKETLRLQILNNGDYILDGRSSTISEIKSIIGSKVKGIDDAKNLTLTIETAENAPVDNVVEIFDVALTYHINPVLAVEKIK